MSPYYVLVGIVIALILVTAGIIIHDQVLAWLRRWTRQGADDMLAKHYRDLAERKRTGGIGHA